MDGEVQELEALARRLAAGHERVLAHRVALARNALVWWEGAAADRYRGLVDERRAELGRLADELDRLAESVTALAAAARADAGPPRVVREGVVTRVTVRSEALAAAASRLVSAADGLRDEAAGVAAALARCRSPAPVALLGAWVRAEADGLRLAGPAGLWGAALGLDVLATRLALAGRAYAEVEQGVEAVLAAVRHGAGAAARGGLLTDAGSRVVLRPRPPVWPPTPLAGPADLVALGEGLDGGHVRVVEVDDGAGGSAWVVAVPGTQRWSPRPGANPFDLTGDVAAVTGDATAAGAGVVAALDAARSASPRAGPDDPVLLVGHSQGGIHAAALASDPDFTGGVGHRVTHVLTTGAPVGVFPVPERVRVLSVEHGDDPVPTLDLTPNPASAAWLTVRAGAGPPLDVGRHGLVGYVRTTRAAQDAPAGTVPGLGAWEASAAAFLHRPVRSVTEVSVERRASHPAQTAPVAYGRRTERGDP